MAGKIAVRNIPLDIWSGLEFLAEKHDRSMEAEARFAIRTWVEPLLRQNERSARRKVVSARLLELLEHVNKAIRGRVIKPSHIAMAIGEEFAESVEGWFAGELEPSFRQLEAIAKFLGGVAEWLQHGDRQMFPIEFTRIPEDPVGGVKWLLDAEDEEKLGELTHLHLIREEGETGGLTVVKQYGDWRSKTFYTPYHISESIGAGGESSLAHLSVVLELLYLCYTKAGVVRTSIKSYVMGAEQCRQLNGGKEHPLVLLGGAIEAPWWEDLWDANQFRNQGDAYWPGWRSLCERINRVVEYKTSLHEERELIRVRKHPFLDEISLKPYPKSSS